MEYSQTGRPIRLDTPLGEDRLLLEGFDGCEGLSQQFGFRARAVSPEDSLPLEQLLNQAAVLTLRMVDDEPRHIHGVVNRAVQLERRHGLTSYELEIVPWTWFLSLITDCRIFLNKSVPDIIRQVFADPGLPDCVSFDFRLSESYEPREYCVQYRETDLNFVSRLMEDEGIFYFFEHHKDKHTLVIADDSTTFKPCPGPSPVPYGAAPAAGRKDDVVQLFSRRFEVCSRTVTLRDFDFENPGDRLHVSEHADRYDLYDYPGAYYTCALGQRYAAIRLQEQEVRKQTLDGSGNCRQFMAGYTFLLDDLSPARAQSRSGEFALTWIQHRASATNYRSEGESPFSYENGFQAIPIATKYRPPRLTPKPVVRGTQTAIVAGPEGEEFCVDKYGRIKLRFHWDRESVQSCPVRVAQSWAGKSWGAIQIPRIGQEVVVDFLEGDPDRPLVIGRVYNAEQMPPYTLPAGQTISGVKSRSAKGGTNENYNEIVLEDKKGEEYIRIHAERDLREHVEQDSYEDVDRDRHLIVGGSRAEQIAGDQHLAVKGEQREEVTGDLSTKVGGSHHAIVGAVYTVDGGREIHIKAGTKVVIESPMQVSLVGPGGFIDIGPAGVSIQGTMVLINSGGSHASGTSSQPKAPQEPKHAEPK
jgi:type VI secretion system secreted protein VgrG